MKRVKKLIVVIFILSVSLFSSACFYVFFAHLGSDKVVVGAVVGWVLLLFSAYSAFQFYLAEHVEAKGRPWAVITATMTALSLLYGVLLVLVD